MHAHTKMSDDVPNRLSLFDNNSVFNSNAAGSGPRPLRLHGGLSKRSSSPVSPVISSAPPYLRGGLASPKSPAHSINRKPERSKRQSSISYISSGDRECEWKLRSIPPLERRRSLALAPSREESDSDDGREENASVAESQPKIPRPMTLAERHADLLRFIAQKEAKCLELRSQLATHEAELLGLKRKWEHIVSRGLGNGELSDVPVTPASKQTAVLEGIKEGVQGVGRFIAGLGDLTPQSPTLTNVQNVKERRRQSTSSISTYSTTKTRLSESSMSSFDATDEDGEHCMQLEEDTTKLLPQPFAASTSTSIANNDYDIFDSPTVTNLSFENRMLLRRRSRDKASFSHTPSKVSEESSLRSPQSLLASTHKRHNSTITKQPTSPPASAAALGTNSSAAGVTAPQISSWVGTVGKKIEELQKGHRRASLMFSDVSNTFLAAFSSPSSAASQNASTTPSMSLLDDDETSTDSIGSKSALDAVMALTPDSLKPIAVAPSDTASGSESPSQVEKRKDEDDDWNW